MRVTATVEMEFPSCHCRDAECECRPLTCQIHATGWVWDSSEGWETKLDEVWGLPEGWSAADLEPRVEERVIQALEENADRRERVVARAPKEMLAIAETLLGILQMPIVAAEDFAQDKRIGALTYGLKNARERLLMLAQEAVS